MKTLRHCEECQADYNGPPLPLENADERLQRLAREHLCPRCRAAAFERHRLAGGWRSDNPAAEAQEERRAAWTAFLHSINAELMEDQDEAWLRRRPQYAQVMAWEYGPRGLLLIGETGCQKTRLAFLLLRREHMAGRNVGYLPAVSFGAMLKAAANRKFGGDGVLLAAWKKVDLLLIDDLGKGGIGDLHEPEMYSIFEARSMARLPTITTQNVGGKDLAAAMSEDRGAPFRRRLQEFFHEAIPFRA